MLLSLEKLTYDKEGKEKFNFRMNDINIILWINK